MNSFLASEGFIQGDILSADACQGIYAEAQSLAYVKKRFHRNGNINCVIYRKIYRPILIEKFEKYSRNFRCAKALKSDILSSKIKILCKRE